MYRPDSSNPHAFVGWLGAGDDAEHHPGLDFYYPTPCRVVAKKGMANACLHSTLEGRNHFSSCLVAKASSPVDVGKVASLNLAPIHKRKHYRVSQRGSKLLHEIQSECGLVTAATMQEPRVRVQTAAEDCSEYFRPEQAIAVIQQDVERIACTTTMPSFPLPTKSFHLCWAQHRPEFKEILCSGISLDPKQLWYICGRCCALCLGLQISDYVRCVAVPSQQSSLVPNLGLDHSTRNR